MREALLIIAGVAGLILWLPLLICVAASFITLDPLWVLHTSIEARATLVMLAAFGFVISTSVICL